VTRKNVTDFSAVSTEWIVDFLDHHRGRIGERRAAWDELERRRVTVSNPYARPFSATDRGVFATTPEGRAVAAKYEAIEQSDMTPFEKYEARWRLSRGKSE
jgi:hypothetical protein